MSRPSWLKRLRDALLGTQPATEREETPEHRYGFSTGQAPSTATPSLPAAAATPPLPRQNPPVSPPAGQQIQWSNSPQPPASPANLPSTRSVPPVRVPASPVSGRVDWGGYLSSGLPDPKTLIGLEDAFEHTQLLAGETVAFCTYDRVAYHLSTWHFLQAQNQGRCCACGQSGHIQVISLPGVYVPSPTPAVAAPRWYAPGEKVIDGNLAQYFIGRAVTVQNYVYGVHQSHKGTYFIQFEPLDRNDAPFECFKAVIFTDYVKEWTRQNMSPLMYRHRVVRVHGVVQDHDKWGLEILVNSPRVMEIVDQPVQKRQ